MKLKVEAKLRQLGKPPSTVNLGFLPLPSVPKERTAIRGCLPPDGSRHFALIAGKAIALFRDRPIKPSFYCPMKKPFPPRSTRSGSEGLRISQEIAALQTSKS